MTKRTRPTTYHALLAHSAGLPMAGSELDAIKASPPSRATPAIRSLLATMSTVKDRPLTGKEASGLRRLRIAAAERSRREPARLAEHPALIAHTSKRGEKTFNFSTRVRGHEGREPFEERTVGYYRRGIRRFERWARRAERLGLDGGRPPAHVARKATDAVRMVEREQ
jgi:hypothetical protein